MRLAVPLVLAGMLLPAAAHASYPHGPGLAPGERPDLGPVQVCNQMLAAERAGHYDQLIARTSIYARERFSWLDKMMLRLARGRLSADHCVQVDQDGGDRVLVGIVAPGGHLSDMPFLKQEGVWRFDQRRWETLRYAGRAPLP